MTGEGSSRDDHDYIAMQTALSETERGRWFLSEHARRHRGGDTQVLLDAIGRIEAVVADRPSVAAPARAGEDMSEIVLMVTRIRDAFRGTQEGASPQEDGARQESLARMSEAATSDVLDATERIQEAAWILRERGVDPAICDLLDQRATEIYAACAVQDGLARRVAVAVELVRSLDERLGGTRATTERDTRVAHVPVPSRPEPSNGQRVGATAIAGRGAAPEPTQEAAAWPLTAPTHDDDAGDAHGADRHAEASVLARPLPGVGAYPTTLDAIDALDVREKLRLFT